MNIRCCGANVGGWEGSRSDAAPDCLAVASMSSLELQYHYNINSTSTLSATNDYTQHRPPSHPFFEVQNISTTIMDSLVAQYSRPIDTEEGQTEEQQFELYSGAPELSLKFALPPVAQV